MPDKFLGIDMNNTSRATQRAAVSSTLIQGHTTSQWWRNQRNTFVAGVMAQVRQGLNDGLSNADMARNLQRSVYPAHRSRANALVATATNAVSNRARIDTFTANTDVIKGMQQVSTLDNKTSDICIAYSGMAWRMDAGHTPIGGARPFNGGPPRHFNCRSTLVPVLKSFAELGLPPVRFPAGTRASIDGQLPGEITFHQFLKGKSKTFQNDLLGPARAKLWRSGAITLNQLVDMRGNPLTVEELMQLSKVRKRHTAAVTVPVQSRDDE